MPPDRKLSIPFRVAAAFLAVSALATAALFVFSPTERQPLESALLMAVGGLIFGFAAITGWKGPTR